MVVDDNVDVHDTSEVLFRLCPKTGPPHDRSFISQSQELAGALDQTTSEILATALVMTKQF